MAGASQTYCYIIELEVLHEHAADLTSVIATNPSLFGQHLVQRGLAVQATVTGIVDTQGINDYRKGSGLVNLVDSKLRAAGTKENVRRYFDDFLEIIAYPMGQRDLAELLVATYKSKDPSYTSPLRESDIPLISTPPGSQQPSSDSTSAGAEAVTTENKVITPCLKEPDISCIVHKLEGLSVDHRTELQSRLYSESTEMVKKFNTLFLSVRRSLDRRQIPPKDVKEVLMGYGLFKPVSQKTNRPVFKEDFEQLQASTTIQDIMQLVRSYCNFFSYDIIEELVSHLGDDEDKKSLSQYTDDFNTYAERKVYEGPAEFSPITDSGQAIICVTLDENYDECTLSHLRLLHYKLCHILQIKGVLRLCRVEPGSILVLFSMPKLLKRLLFPLSVEQQMSLFAITAVKVVRLKCGEYEYLKEGTLPGHPLTSDCDDSASVCTIDSGFESILSSDQFASMSGPHFEPKLHPKPRKVGVPKFSSKQTGRLFCTRGQRGTAKYECGKCGQKWKVKNSSAGKKTCTNLACRDRGILPCDFTPNAPLPKRMFGEFDCSCGHQWKSGYAWMEWDKEKKGWVDYRQKCRSCRSEVYPTSLRPLRYTGGNESQKSHDSEACEMCRKHGDCRNIITFNTAEDNISDHVIMLSETKTLFFSDVYSDPDDHTPVNSDEETTDDFLSGQLMRLSFK